MKLIKIDIDLNFDVFCRNFLRKYVEHVQKILKMYNIKYKYIKLERSTNNRVHVKILLSKEVSVEEGLWLQFVLGDDHKRVFFNMLRFEHWKEETERFNVLFSEKYKFKRKKSEKK